jgi:predicted CDP-diglyceride synthetase/phosphatidate cytidylyltransferase
MARVYVFHATETLLDLKALDEHFGRVFADAGVRPIWFAQMIQSALVATVTDAYADFGTLGGFVGYVVLPAIKGDLQLKDRGAMTLGRGGILNRIDAIIYTAPLYFSLFCIYTTRDQ